MIAMTRSFCDKNHNEPPRPATRPLGSFASILTYLPSNGAESRVMRRRDHAHSRAQD